MKIWQKIFLITLLIAMSVMMIEFVMANNEYHIQLNQEIKKAQYLHEELYLSIHNKINDRKTSENRKYLDDSTYKQLMDQGVKSKQYSEYGIKMVINSNFEVTNYHFYAMNTDDMNIIKSSQPKYKITYWRDNYQLIFKSMYIIDGNELVTVSHHDVSNVYELYMTQIESLQGAGVLLLLEAMLILLIMVQSLLIPLRNLRKGIREITEGNYGKQLKTRGNTEITELTRDINQMSEKIAKNIGEMEEMAENRKVFIDNMSHEMKTPLTAILGFADILTIMPDITDEQKREYSEHIYREALRLRTMSGKLMELVQLQENNLRPEIINLKDLLNDVADTENIILTKSEISLNKILCDAVIEADSDLLKSLFFNILDNAQKATQSGGSIDIVMKRIEDLVQVRIHDYGIGIPKEEIKKITEPFYMIDKSRSRKSGGAGLGLALCQTIVSLNNGTMEIESEEGKGCTVIVTLPLFERSDSI